VLNAPEASPQTVAETDVARWLTAARNGDADAFRRIVETYQRAVYGIAYRMTLNHADADDLAQDAFVALWSAIESIDTARPLLPWLRRTTINRCINWLARKRRRAEAALDPDVISASPAVQSRQPAPSDRMQEQEAQARIRNALETLSPDWQATFVLRTHAGLSYQQIANEMNCSIGTVMSRLHRVRVALKDALKA